MTLPQAVLLGFCAIAAAIVGVGFAGQPNAQGVVPDAKPIWYVASTASVPGLKNGQTLIWRLHRGELSLCNAIAGGNARPTCTPALKEVQ